jgi:low temperature requirement protein LtrA
MVAIGVMAAAVPEALTDRAAAFAIGNALIRLVWFYPWFAMRRSIGVPRWRPVLYSLVPAGIWVASIFVPPPAQFTLWVVAVAIEVALLSALGGQAEWLRRTLDIDHLAERISLLVVIVFGESILSIIAEFDEHWAPLPAVTAVLGLLAVSVLAWIFFGYGAGAAERGLRDLQSRGSIGGLRDTVMYFPFLLIAGITLFAAALGTAVADAGHHLAPGAAVCLASGISLFFITCAAESLRYGVPWRHLLLWAPAGVLLPWVLVPLAAWVDATAVVAASVVLLAVLAGLNELNVRRMRTRGALVEAR